MNWGLSRFRVVSVDFGRPRLRAVPRLRTGAESSRSSPRARTAVVLVERPLVERAVAPGSASSSPVSKGQKLGEVRVYDRRRLIARSPLVASRSVSKPSTLDRAGWYVGRTAHNISGLGTWITPRSSPSPSTRLLDRTLTVPNFQRGQRHRASQGLTLAGRQGDQHRPRAEAARRAGRRDRARGRPHRHADRRGATARGDPQRLRPHRRRVAHVDGRRRPDRGHVHARSTSGARQVSPRSSRSCARSSTTSRAAPSRSSSRARCRAASTTTSTRTRSATSTAAASRPCSTPEGEPLRLGIEAEPFLVSPNQREAESARRPGVPRATQDFVVALDSIAELGARNVLITQETGCFALLREEREAQAASLGRGIIVGDLGGRLGGRAPGRVPRGAARRQADRGGAPSRSRGRSRLDARGRRRPVRSPRGEPPHGRSRGRRARARGLALRPAAAQAPVLRCLATTKTPVSAGFAGAEIAVRDPAELRPCWMLSGLGEHARCRPVDPADVNVRWPGRSRSEHDSCTVRRPSVILPDRGDRGLSCLRGVTILRPVAMSWAREPGTGGRPDTPA